MPWHFRTLCESTYWFSFSSLIYINIKMLQSIPANIASWSGKTILMPNFWPSRSVLRWMSVIRNREIRNMVLLSSSGLRLACLFLFWISLWFMCVWLEKTTVLVMCIYIQTSPINCFRRFHKIVRWIGSSDFKDQSPRIQIIFLKMSPALFVQDIPR